MGAIIDKDHLEGDGLEGYAGMEFWGGPTSDDVVRFKLLDDDGELYYSGRLDREDLYVDDERLGYELAYELWRWGMADSGCTELAVDELDGKGFRSIYA